MNSTRTCSAFIATLASMLIAGSASAASFTQLIYGSSMQNGGYVTDDDTPTNAIPEPSAALVFLLGGLTLSGRFRHGRR